MRRRLATAVVGLGILGCHPVAADSEAPDRDPVGPTGDEGADRPEVRAQDGSSGPCGPTGEELHGLSWVPRAAELTALVELNDAGLEEALAALAGHARRDAPTWPVDVAFELAQWDFEVPLVRATLRRAGFEPAELAAVRLDAVGTAWVFGSTCDLEDAIGRVSSIWGVHVRRTANGAIGTPASDGARTFPFDVVFLPGDRIALVAAGHGADSVRALQGRAATGTETPRPGPMVEALPEAPIRAFVRGIGFGGAGSGEAEGGQRFRVTREGVEIGGSLAPSP